MENNDLIKNEGGIIQYVGNAVNITSKLLSVNLKSLKILHLDDHSLFSWGLSKCILEKFPNADIKNIQNGDKALEYVLNCLGNKDLLDLIITDINHPGLDGIKFSRAIREKEKYNEHKIPILFVTMVDDKFIVSEVENIPFVKHLTKTTQFEIINFAINNFI